LSANQGAKSVDSQVELTPLFQNRPEIFQQVPKKYYGISGGCVVQKQTKQKEVLSFTRTPLFDSKYSVDAKNFPIQLGFF
jgi:hypothetical protein